MTASLLAANHKGFHCTSQLDLVGVKFCSHAALDTRLVELCRQKLTGGCDRFRAVTPELDQAFTLHACFLQGNVACEA